MPSLMLRDFGWRFRWMRCWSYFLFFAIRTGAGAANCPSLIAVSLCPQCLYGVVHIPLMLVNLTWWTFFKDVLNLLPWLPIPAMLTNMSSPLETLLSWSIPSRLRWCCGRRGVIGRIIPWFFGGYLLCLCVGLYWVKTWQGRFDRMRMLWVVTWLCLCYCLVLCFAFIQLQDGFCSGSINTGSAI